jgi:hypothetical protein
MDAKRKITITATCLIIAAIVVAAFTIIRISNPDIAAYTEQAQKIFNQAKTVVEKTRNATLPDVKLVVITQQEAVDRWGKPSSTTDLTRINRKENIYKGLFMMSETDSLYQATAEWTANWVAATLPGEIYVIYENFHPWDMPGAEAIFVHEFTHIWEPSLTTSTTFDMDKAHAALVEGDASYMGDYFKDQYNTQASPATLLADQGTLFLIDNPAFDAIHPIPSTISNIDWFPYIKGKDFVTTLYEENGWATVNQAYQLGYTPSTTEQILHPDKYFANETAQAVSAPTLTEDTWTIVKTDYNENHNTYGEYFIQNMLGNWLNQNESQKAAAGWAGDNLTYYERGGEYLFTWNLKWDSPTDASEFYAAFHNMINASGAAADNSSHWSANGRYLMIEWNQNSNTTLIAVSTNQTAVQESYFT